MATIKARLRTPADPNGIRQNIDVITNADSVVFENGQTLDEALAEIAESSMHAGLIISESTDKPNPPAMWGEIWSDVHDR